MTCEDLVELVTAYLEGGLDDVDREVFEGHLERCPGCERYVDQFRDTIALLGELRPETISADARSALLEAFAGWRVR
jgi:anti-sigma factor RsiW